MSRFGSQRRPEGGEDAADEHSRKLYPWLVFARCYQVLVVVGARSDDVYLEHMSWCLGCEAKALAACSLFGCWDFRSGSCCQLRCLVGWGGTSRHWLMAWQITSNLAWTGDVCPSRLESRS